MALKLPAGLKTLIQSGNYDAHAGLDVSLDGGTLRMATAELLLPGNIAYAPTLRMRGSVKQSLRKVTDNVELTGQNIDNVLGQSMLDAADVLNAAEATFLYFFFGHDGSFYQVKRLIGELTAARINETQVRLKLLSDLSAGGSVAGNRTVGINCGLRFKKRGCDSTSPDGFCSKVRDDAVHGCASKQPAARIVQIGAANNIASFGGMDTREGLTFGSSVNNRIGGSFDGLDPDDPARYQGLIHGRHQLPYLMRAA